MQGNANHSEWQCCSPDAGVIAATEYKATTVIQCHTSDGACMAGDQWLHLTGCVTVEEAHFAVSGAKGDEVTAVCVKDTARVLADDTYENKVYVTVYKMLGYRYLW